MTTAARAKGKSTDPAADVAEVRRGLDLLNVPGGVVEIRALKIPQQGRGKPFTAAGYFTDLDKAAQAAVALDARKAAGVYLVLNETNPALLARSPNQATDHLEPTTSDIDIIRRRWLPLDFDPKRPSGISSTNAEHDAAQAAARECADWLREDAGWPEPILADSGNGWHVLYRVDLPNDEAARALVQGAIRAIAERFTGRGIDVDQTVYNAARIFKVYGTTARKGCHMADRPHRVARLVDVPSTVQVVPQPKLEALAATVAKPAPATSAGGQGHGQTFTSHLDVPRWLAARGVSFKVKDRPTSDGRTVYLLEHCPFDQGHGGSGETSIMQGPDGSLSAKCMHNSCSRRGWKEFKAAIGPPDADHWDPPLSDDRNNGATTEPAGKAGDKKDRFPLVTCATLDSNDYTPRAIIEGMLFAGSPTVCGGMFKTLKTLLATDLAISVATGRSFFGRFPVVAPLRVVYFTGEGGPCVAQEYARRIAESKGLQLAEATNLQWCFRVPRFEDFGDLDAIQRVYDQTGAEVMVFDNLMLCLSGDNAGNVYKMGNVLGNVIRVCTERGITPVFVHHFKRTRGNGDLYAPGELLDLTQAGAAEIAGGWLLLARREPFDADQPGEHKLWLTAGGRVGHSSLHALDVHEGRRSDPGGRRWEVEIFEASEVRKEKAEQAQAARDEKRRVKAATELEADRRELVKAATRMKKPQTQTDLRERTTLGHGERFKRAFDSLIEDGTLQPAEIIKGNNRPVPAWKLREEDP